MNLLDDLSDAPISTVRDVLHNKSPGFRQITEMIEYEFFRRGSRPELPPLIEFSPAVPAHQIQKAMDDRKINLYRLSLQPIPIDFTAIPRELSAIPAWTAFVKRAEVTAREVGFANEVAAGIAGAIQELADNVVRHSEVPDSGMAGFANSNGTFEYIIADAGVGMLQSLRNAPEFASLRDDLEALPLAITPGVSRFGRGSGFGYGFRAVFLPLRAAVGKIRLRSGSAVLSVEGSSIRPDLARCSQRPHHQGVVVSVTISP